MLAPTRTHQAWWCEHKIWGLILNTGADGNRQLICCQDHATFCKLKLETHFTDVPSKRTWLFMFCCLLKRRRYALSCCTSKGKKINTHRQACVYLGRVRDHEFIKYTFISDACFSSAFICLIFLCTSSSSFLLDEGHSFRSVESCCSADCFRDSTSGGTVWASSCTEPG